ncbi:hypothetical protein Fcan01_23079 [Folsomia candida]|uniref:Uncharacterized protein n=2 Tax=Folsomia candida TaxID=158441 RepID=A0A226DBI6_FOLCA|nr:hypothetical protein Fcan01_23079 [Folsomia candida]
MAPACIIHDFREYYGKLVERAAQPQGSDLGSELMAEKLRRVRRFGVYCVVVVLIWIPLGMWLTWERIVMREVAGVEGEPKGDTWIWEMGLVLYYTFIGAGPSLALWTDDALLGTKFVDLFIPEERPAREADEEEDEHVEVADIHGNRIEVQQ